MGALFVKNHLYSLRWKYSSQTIFFVPGFKHFHIEVKVKIFAATLKWPFRELQLQLLGIIIYKHAVSVLFAR